MDFKDIVATMTPEIRDNLSRAIEIGRWPDGGKLTAEQKSSSMQAIIAWDSFYGKETNEPFRVQKGGKYNSAVKTPSANKGDIKIISS